MPRQLTPSTTRAFHELENKGIVTVVDKEPYRGREFSKYWLTNRGLAHALLNGANPESTKNNAMMFSKDSMTMDFFEFRSISPKIANLLDQTMLRVGKINPFDLAIQSLIVGISMEEVSLQKFVDIIKKSTEHENFMKSLGVIKQSIEILDKMLTRPE